MDGSRAQRDYTEHRKHTAGKRVRDVHGARATAYAGR